MYVHTGLGSVKGGGAVHHRKVPYPPAAPRPKSHRAGDADAGNLLVQGDNPLALEAPLLYAAR